MTLSWIAAGQMNTHAITQSQDHNISSFTFVNVNCELHSQHGARNVLHYQYLQQDTFFLIRYLINTVPTLPRCKL